MVVETAKAKFLWGLVTGTFVKYRTLGLDEQSTALARKLAEGFPAHSARVISTWADVVTHTINLEFHWPDRDQVPEPILALEEFWKKYQDGTSLELCYEFYAAQVGNTVMFAGRSKESRDWQDAMLDAQQAWQPPDEWKLLDDVPEEKQQDPFFSNSTNKSDTT